MNRLVSGALPRCEQCSALLEMPLATRTKRGGVAWVAVAIWCFIWSGIAGWDWSRQSTELRQAEADLVARSRNTSEASATEVDRELEAIRTQRNGIEAAHRARMQDRDMLSGARAAKLHSDEWEARLRRDPAFARSLLESNLLKMELTARDTSLPTAQSLHAVATLAAPPKSRIQISPESSRFHVRIAFEMGSLSWEEAGSATRHESADGLRRDAESMSARVLRDVLAACGSRDVERITVSCNRPLTVIPDEVHASIDTVSRPRVSRPRMTSIFRVSVDRAQILTSADWRRASLPQVGKASRVEFDMTRRLRMNPLLAEEQVMLEPEGELEF